MALGIWTPPYLRIVMPRLEVAPCSIGDSCPAPILSLTESSY